MKKCKSLFLLTVILNLSVSAQSTLFSRTYLHGNYEDARGILQLSDGNLMVTGLEKGTVDSMGSLYVSKLDTKGNILWQKFYDYPKEDGGNHIMVSRFGNIIVTGHTESTVGECDGYLLKIDQQGEMIWRKQIGGLEDDVFNASVEDHEGTIYTIGRTENYGASDMDILLHLTSSDGTPINGFHFGTTDYDYATSVVFNSDNELLISGVCVGKPASETDAIVVKCDRFGKLIWQKRFEHSGTDAAQKIIPIADGKMLVLGKKQTGINITQGWICCLDKDGNILWEKTYGNSGKDEFFTATKTHDNNTIIAGTTPAGKDSLADLWVCIVDDLGNLKQEFITGSSNFDIPSSLCICTDLTLCIAGKQRILSRDSQSYIVKTDLNGTLSDFIPKGEFKIAVYPNPARDYCIFSTPDNYAQKTIVIYTFTGKTLLLKTYSENQILIDPKKTGKGIFYYTITDAQGKLMTSGKLLFE